MDQMQSLPSKTFSSETLLRGAVLVRDMSFDEDPELAALLQERERLLVPCFTT